MRRFWSSVIIGGLLALAATSLATGQSFSTQIQIAINQLTTGVTPFTQLRSVANTYYNFGSTSGVAGYGIRDNAGVIETKNSSGSWLPLPTSSNLPTNAPYITKIPDSNLSNEFALSGLATALLVNTTVTGVPTAYAGTTCTAQVISALSATGAATCVSVAVTDTTGTLSVARGGTGLTAGTSGGVLGYTNTGTLASSGLLALNAVLLGGGAGAVPSSLGSTGTTTTVLHGNGGGAPSWAAVNLATDTTGTVTVAQGGTNSAAALSGSSIMITNGSGIVQGAAGTATTVLHGNAAGAPTYSAVALAADVSGTLPVTSGGTGLVIGTSGGVLGFTTTTGLTSSVALTVNNLILGGGVGATPTPLGTLGTTTTLLHGNVGGAPSWSAVSLTTDVAGILPVSMGGTNLTSYIAGDLLMATAPTTIGVLAAVPAPGVLITNGAGVAPSYTADLALTTFSATDAIYAPSHVETVAVAKTPSAAESGETYTNGVDTDGVAFTLLNDPAPAGIYWDFGVSTTLVSGSFSIAPSAGETLNLGTAVCSAITATEKGSTVRVRAVSAGAGASFLAFDAVGSWVCAP